MTRVVTRSRRVVLPGLAVAAAVATAACSDRPSTAPGDRAPDDAGTLSAALACAVDVRAATMTCAPAGGSEPGARASRVAGGPRLDLTVGGQGTYIRLATSGPQTRDDATGIVSGPVTVTNLMTQPLGSSDGSTASGVRVFFHQLPTVTQGTGTVDVANPDGVGVFTGANQPFHLYNQVLAPGETSAPKTWQFRVPATVQAFAFQVYVRAALPAEQGVLRWTTLPGGGIDVWGSGPNDIFVVNGGSTLSRWDGASWTTFSAFIPSSASNGNRSANLTAVWGRGPNDVYAVGMASGGGFAGGISIWRFDGSALTEVYKHPGSLSFGLNDAGPASSGPSPEVQAAGDRVIVRSCQGSSTCWFEQDFTSTSKQFYGIDINSGLAVGSGRQGLTDPTCALAFGYTIANGACPAGAFRGAWSAGAGNVWVVGDGGMIYRTTSAQPQVLNPVASPVTTTLFGIWGSAANDIYAVGDGGVILHYDGTAWTREESGTTATLRAVWGSGPADVWVVGGGVMLRGTR